MRTTLPQLIAQAARNFGDGEAIVAPDGRMSFTDIDRLSDEVAKGLVAAGVGRGDHVGICAGNSARWLVVFFGIVKAGAVCVPINTRLKADEIRYQLGQARVRLLFLAGRVLSSDLLAIFDEVARGMAAGFPQSDLPGLETVVLVDGAAHPSCLDFSAFVARGGERACRRRHRRMILRSSNTLPGPRACRRALFCVTPASCETRSQSRTASE